MPIIPKEEVQHTRPFNLAHAKAGAPFRRKSGEEVEVLKWDAKGGNCPIVGMVGEDVVRWAVNGNPGGIGNKQAGLVMTPLGFLDGKPVFAGDVLEDNEGFNMGEAFTVGPKMREGHFSHCHWPAPEQVYPETQLNVNALVAMHEGVLDQSGIRGGRHSAVLAVANAAIRHAIDAGQVVAPENLRMLQAQALNDKEWMEKTSWVQNTASSFNFSTTGMHRADVMKREIEQLRELYKDRDRYLGIAERLLETLGYRSAGNGEWKTPAVPQLFAFSSGEYVQGDEKGIERVSKLAHRGSKRDCAIAGAVLSACSDAIISDYPIGVAFLSQIDIPAIIAQVKA